MKYMIEYAVRFNGLGHEDNLANQEALLTAFGKWAPEEGLTVHAFVGRLDGRKGYVLVEAAETKTVTSFVTKFLYWNDVEVIPVDDIGELVPINLESNAWARSAAGG